MSAAELLHHELTLAALLQRPLVIGGDVRVRGLTADSRALRPGWVFAACAGDRRHGMEFVDQALEHGAAAVLWEPTPDGDGAEARERCRSAGVPVLEYPGLGRDLGRLASRAFGDPSRALRVIGITGTDGKTSVSQFLAQVLEGKGGCGLIGTLGHGLPGRLQPAANTTPDGATVQALLAGFRDAGLASVSMEVSSHGIDQGRVSAVRFDTAVLTNLGRDHLDYHGTVEAYAEAKRRLFLWEDLRCAVLNADDSFGCAVRRTLPPQVRCVDYSLFPDVDAAVVCTHLALLPEGMELTVITPFGVVEARLPLMGRFNAANVLAVIGVLVGLDWTAPEIARGLEQVRPVPGRMERYRAAGRPLVVVDYAHTPGALQAALAALREHVDGRIWCVFGCGGERDPGKRSQMGAAAEAGADRVIVTDDNPRGEDPERIVAQILEGFGRTRPEVEHDRATAIGRAVEEAGPGDVVLVAGKGHEDYQVTPLGVRHYSDRDTVRALLNGGEA
ncbi:MAG: UDP-N-acetylmuramoyl-L-alanyl-D-glutamate--2,6-diaminopimelate ligase [Ectothiorhodospiraceae bacterium]|nr:UDP-N-acetylmuramoyl-L-alanyl-D-glutamate--2,6-diaminopimelate ligase [Ectothiorhodospiraceae bacterium]